MSSFSTKQYSVIIIPIVTLFLVSCAIISKYPLAKKNEVHEDLLVGVWQSKMDKKDVVTIQDNGDFYVAKKGQKKDSFVFTLVKLKEKHFISVLGKGDCLIWMINVNQENLILYTLNEKAREDYQKICKNNVVVMSSSELRMWCEEHINDFSVPVFIYERTNQKGKSIASQGQCVQFLNEFEKAKSALEESDPPSQHMLRNMEQSIARLKFNYQKHGDLLVVSPAGGAKVHVVRQSSRNVNNVVTYSIGRIWREYYTKAQIEEISALNRSIHPFRFISDFRDENALTTLILTIEIKENIPENYLAAVISMLARLKSSPVKIDVETQQYKAIKEILDKTQKIRSTDADPVWKIEQMNKLNFQADWLPKDFYEAYARHFNAWVESCNVQNGAMLGGLMGSIFGETGAALGSLVGAALENDSKSGDISSTFNKLLHVASRYGVDTAVYW